MSDGSDNRSVVGYESLTKTCHPQQRSRFFLRFWWFHLPYGKTFRRRKTFFSSGLKPFFEEIIPKNSTLSVSNWHFSLFSVKLFAFSRPKTACRATSCSFTVLPNTKISLDIFTWFGIPFEISWRVWWNMSWAEFHSLVFCNDTSCHLREMLWHVATFHGGLADDRLPACPVY